MQRLLTAAIGVPLSLLAVFKLPGWAFFLLVAFFFAWAALEFVALVRPLAPRAPWRILLLTATATAAALVVAIDPDFFPRFAASPSSHLRSRTWPGRRPGRRKKSRLRSRRSRDRRIKR